jgi:RNA polymerase sigma factor (sigma-70 family)
MSTKMKEKKVEDIVIIEEILNGSRDSYGFIVERYERLVFSIAFNILHDRGLAEDVSQEAFMKAYLHLNSYNPEYRFSTWISRITMNTCTDVLRKRKDSLPIEEAETIADDAITPEETVIMADEAKGLMLHVNNLDEKYKDPLMMYHSQGLKYEEIARRLNLPMTIIKNRIFRARKMLRIMISEAAC